MRWWVQSEREGASCKLMGAINSGKLHGHRSVIENGIH